MLARAQVPAAAGSADSSAGRFRSCRLRAGHRPDPQYELHPLSRARQGARRVQPRNARDDDGRRRQRRRRAAGQERRQSAHPPRRRPRPRQRDAEEGLAPQARADWRAAGLDRSGRALARARSTSRRPRRAICTRRKATAGASGRLADVDGESSEDRGVRSIRSIVCSRRTSRSTRSRRARSRAIGGSRGASIST